MTMWEMANARCKHCGHERKDHDSFTHACPRGPLVTVPREPTADMIGAAFDLFEMPHIDGYRSGNDARVAIYRAMIGAAPRTADASLRGKDLESALTRFREYGGDEEPDPLERLRFFCSLAMCGQDWLDVEQFFDAAIAARLTQTTDAQPVTMPPNNGEQAVFYRHPLDKKWYPADCWPDFNEAHLGTPWNPQEKALFVRVQEGAAQPRTPFVGTLLGEVRFDPPPVVAAGQTIQVDGSTYRVIDASGATISAGRAVRYMP